MKSKNNLNIMQGKKLDIDDFLGEHMLVLGSDRSESQRVELLLLPELARFPTLPVFVASTNTQVRFIRLIRR